MEMVTIVGVESQRNTDTLRALGTHEQPMSPRLARTAERGSPADGSTLLYLLTEVTGEPRGQRLHCWDVRAPSFLEEEHKFGHLSS